MIITIVDFKKRTNSEGEEFNALILQGGLKMVKSKESVLRDALIIYIS